MSHWSPESESVSETGVFTTGDEASLWVPATPSLTCVAKPAVAAAPWTAPLLKRSERKFELDDRAITTPICG